MLKIKKIEKTGSHNKSCFLLGISSSIEPTIFVTSLGLVLWTCVSVVGDEVIDQGSLSFNTAQKLKTIVVSIDFSNAKVDDIFKALTPMSKQADPYHKGI